LQGAELRGRLGVSLQAPPPLFFSNILIIFLKINIFTFLSFLLISKFQMLALSETDG
jgi:hypothetical protein